jgi:hypothetical protein
MPRLTFLSHFVLCLAIGASAWFAYVHGVFAAVWANDQSMMTSVICVLFLVTTAWLGWQAWQVDAADPSFGHLAERLLPMLGLFGTAFGLSLQAKALAGGSAAFTPLATSLYCTACGVLAAALVAVMTFNLEAGIRRAER